MTRTDVRRRRRLLAVSVAVVGAMIVSAPVAGALGRHQPARVRTRNVYVVQPGDTLWSIAERSGEGDPRALVDAIAARNGVGAGAIVPGLTLVIPPTG